MSKDALRTLKVAGIGAATLAAIGCAGMFQTTNTSAPEEDNEYTGTVTVENRSGYALCETEIQGQDHTMIPRIDDGASATATVGSDVHRILLADCDSDQTLHTHPMNWYGTAIGPSETVGGLEHDRIVIYAPGAAPASADDHLAIEVNPRPMSQWIFFDTMTDNGAATQMHNALIQHASRSGWTEDFQVFFIAEPDWRIIRNEWTSIIERRAISGAGLARWPDGHCTMQAFSFQQQHDGNGFTGAIQYAGVSTQLPVNCRLLEYAAARPDSVSQGVTASSRPASSAPATTAAPSGGGGGEVCTNTCRTSNDNECDDGGPGSLYSVCAYGTDCGDCGSRPAQGAAPAGQCSDTCRTSGDGECDDGGPGSLYSVCAYGTDCTDCGPR